MNQSLLSFFLANVVTVKWDKTGHNLEGYISLSSSEIYHLQVLAGNLVAQMTLFM